MSGRPPRRREGTSQPGKRTAAASTATAIEIAQRGFAGAIAACARRWQERWGRPPTTNELVRAFEICVAASPDDLVSDVASVLALSPGRAAPPPLDLEAFEVQLRATGPHGLPRMEFHLRSRGAMTPGSGEVRADLEVRGETLLVDIDFAEHRQVPRFDQACLLVQERGLRRWLVRHGGAIRRVVLRPMAGLDDPVTLPWSPPEDGDPG